ncbi:autophagy protein Apg9-domain-containing protein [Vararia minispora EC-137]|uniref:Autophagy protein Apg9-domain-containing protein n=1 Tax=Vararia minispora EC-137 TaxID=1314806 RepID=A0ACB8QLE3_9AGAM|nr:autophagy protein Apg9-domain-containing protein [Vararia minispora EC-137]
MASPNRRQSLASRSLFASRSLHGSRPFLNLLNPLGNNYAGYSTANQSVLEEEAEDDDDQGAIRMQRSHTAHDDDIDVEAQTSASTRPPRPSHLGASVLRPNIHREDRMHEESESDDEVPQSFMIESPARPPSSRLSKGKARQTLRPASQNGLSIPTGISVPPRPSEINIDDQRLPEPVSQQTQRRQMRGLDAYERALWKWVNVYNLDSFLQEVYFYYEGKGLYSIALARGLNLLTVGFVIGFSTFLLRCVDYSRIRPEQITRLSDIIVGRCVTRFSGFTLLVFSLFCFFYVWQIISFVLSTMRLLDMYNFYTHLLNIPDEDIPTISWPEIVRRIAAIRNQNPLTAISSSSQPRDTDGAKLDAHDIANRIMRQENYLIALFNKELLDLRVPLPRFIGRFAENGKGRTLTRALEWNLRFCLIWYLFDARGKVRKVFLKSKNRAALIEGLRRRFIFMGILNFIFSPFIVLYLVMYSFFRYFDEYHKNPSSIGGRAYTPFAEWKFREFNELPHLFRRRLDESYPIATAYIGQFPNEKVAIVMRFVAFIAGSFAAVLFLASILDPDLFLHFEITPHRTVVFYITLFGGILAVARGMIPEDNRVYDSEELMLEAVRYTHYLPDVWRTRLHSKVVHNEFGELFQMKILTFAQELASVVLTPFILWYSLPPCAPAIVDFFREFTVHVDGLGFVCSFAVFDFERHGNVKFGAPTKVKDERLMSREGKMEQSFLNFTAAHPEWVPSDPSGSLYLSRMADFGTRRRAQQHRREPPALPSKAADAPAATNDEQLAARAREYERALAESQSAAVTRRRGTLGVSSMFIGQQRTPDDMQASVFQSAMARTAVLGDSGTTLPPAASESEIVPEDRAADDGIADGLEGSYVDGAARRGRGAPPGQSMQEEEEELADGGVLGLLAQIYSGPGEGRAAGPVRAFK